MNKLKTLKDIEGDRSYTYDKNLKAEAVKWIKYLDQPCDEPFDPDKLRQFWIDRFNLTKKDLK